MSLNLMQALDFYRYTAQGGGKPKDYKSAETFEIMSKHLVLWLLSRNSQI